MALEEDPLLIDRSGRNLQQATLEALSKVATLEHSKITRCSQVPVTGEGGGVEVDNLRRRQRRCLHVSRHRMSLTCRAKSQESGLHSSELLTDCCLQTAALFLHRRLRQSDHTLIRIATMALEEDPLLIDRSGRNLQQATLEALSKVATLEHSKITRCSQVPVTGEGLLFHPLPPAVGELAGRRGRG